MSQSAALQAMDAQILGAFAAAGLADAASYTAPGGAVTAGLTVLVDRDVRMYGDDAAEVPTAHVVVTLYRAQVEGARGGVVTLLDAAGAPIDTLTLDAKLDQDESRVRWVVLA